MIDQLISLAPPTAVQASIGSSPQEQPSSTQAVPDETKDESSILVENQEQIDSLLHQQQKQLETLIRAGAGQPTISLLLNKAQQLQELQAIQQKLISDSNTGQPPSNTQSPVPPSSTMETKSATAKLSEFSKVKKKVMIVVFYVYFLFYV